MKNSEKLFNKSNRLIVANGGIPIQHLDKILLGDEEIPKPIVKCPFKTL